MSGRIEALEDVIEKSLTVGLALSTVLLIFGLVAGAPGPLRWGIVLLMLTPVVRVAVVTIGLALERDWTFTIVSSVVLVILAFGIWVGVR